MPVSLRRAHLLALAALAALGLLALAPAAPAVAHPARQATFGATTLRLDPGTARALKSLGVQVAPVGPARATREGIAFPITNPLPNALATRTIRHSGGIALSAGSTRVELRRFFIRVDRDPDLTALVGDRRVSILSLDFSRARISLSHGRLRIAGVQARLTRAAAGALNQAFGVSAFTAGLKLGETTTTYRLPRVF